MDFSSILSATMQAAIVCGVIGLIIIIDVVNANYVNEGTGDMALMIIMILFFVAMTITAVWFLLYCVFWKIHVVGNEVTFTAFRKIPKPFCFGSGRTCHDSGVYGHAEWHAGGFRLSGVSAHCLQGHHVFPYDVS